MSEGHTHVAEGETLTSVEEHLASILGTIRPLAPTELSLGDTHGLVLAEDVTAASPLPSFDNSAMDGYAVRVEDVAAASEENPVTLPVVAEVAAGDTGAYALPPGTSIRIMTGAMLPHGTEAVVPVEMTDGGRTRVAIRAKVDFGHSVRLAGGDAKAGEVLVTAGTRLRPMHIAVIAAAGRGTVLVRPRPRVVVLSTGNELAEPGTPIIPGRIWDSNSFMIAAAAREAGCLAYRQAIVPDNPEQVLPAIEDQLARADLLITTGGVSMGGEHDVIKAALRQLGTIEFRKVAMQPGMPQGFGTVALPASAAPEHERRGGLLSRARGPRRDDGDPGEAGRARPRADLHPARQPGQCLRIVPDLRPPRPRRSAGLRRPGPGDGPGRADRAAALAARPAFVRARGAGPPGRAGRPADRPGIAPGGHARQGQRADHCARGGGADGRGRHGRRAGAALRGAGTTFRSEEKK